MVCGALDDLVDFSPKRSIKKGVIAPFVAMADIPVHSKSIGRISEREFKGGGSRFSNGDTLFARITPCLENGKTGKVSGLQDGTVAHGSTEFIVMAAKYPKFDQNFIYYLARLPEFRKYAESRMEGTSGRQRVSWQSIAAYEFSYPPKEERKIIGEFLCILDDKIELNSKMNATLESMAQAMFKSWFVDFDPVIDNALAAGNPIPELLHTKAETRKALGDKRKPLPDTIKKQFPSCFVFSEEMGWIPEGWAVKQLPELAEFQNGFAFYTVGYSETGYKVVDLANISSSGKFIETHRDKFVSSEVYHLPKHEQHHLHKNDLVMAMTDMTQAMGILGKCGVIKESDRFILNQRIGRIRARKGVNVNFLFTYFNSSSQIDFLQRRALGTVQKYVNTNHIKEMCFTIPDQRIMDYFGENADALYSKISSHDNQIIILSGLRDTLLPQLLSGQLRIPDAGKLVADAV